MTQPPDPPAMPVLDGVRALVTGGTSGLGFAMSQALAQAGARVALTGRTEQRVQAAAAGITSVTGTGIVMDVRDEQSVSAGVDRALAVLGGVDVLVNNAGIGVRTVNPHFMTEPAGFWQVSPDGFRDLFATNVLGYFVPRVSAGRVPRAAASRRAVRPAAARSPHGRTAAARSRPRTQRR